MKGKTRLHEKSKRLCHVKPEVLPRSLLRVFQRLPLVQGAHIFHLPEFPPAQRAISRDDGCACRQGLNDHVSETLVDWRTRQKDQLSCRMVSGRGETGEDHLVGYAQVAVQARSGPLVRLRPPRT